MPDLEAEVRRLMASGASDDDITFYIKHRPPDAPTVQAPSPYEEAKAKGLRMAMGDPSRRAAMSPTEKGAMLGGLAVAPFTGGLSALPAMAATGMAGAAGAGTGSLVNQAMTGQADPHLGRTMAVHGGLQGLGAGLPYAATAIADRAVPAVLKNAILRPSPTIQKDFPDVVETMRATRIPVGQSAVADARAEASADATDAFLKAKAAERPTVKGLLGPAREAHPLGPTPTPGDMPMRVSEAGALRLNRPPVSELTGKRFAEFHPGDPEELLFSSKLDSSGRPIPDLPSPEFGGPGVMYRPMKSVGGPGAPKGMVDPRELASELKGLRAELGNRPLNDRAVGELDSLVQEMLAGHQGPLTLVQANAIKRQAQKLAHAAYTAADNHMPVNMVEAGFNKGVAAGAQKAVEARAPDVIPMNQNTQSLMGLNRALQAAELRPKGGMMGANPINWVGGLMPGVGSQATFAADKFATQTMQSPPAALIRQALLAMLGGTGQDGSE